MNRNETAYYRTAGGSGGRGVQGCVQSGDRGVQGCVQSGDRGVQSDMRGVQARAQSGVLCVLAAVAAAFLAASCATKPAQPIEPVEPVEPISPTEQAIGEPSVAEPAAPAEPVFTRIAFGEQLSALIADGRFDEAIALFDTVPENEAGELSMRMLRLSVLISAGRTEQSAALANALEKEHPNNPEIAYIQAMLATARNDMLGRTKYLNQVLKNNPGHSLAMVGLGLDLLGKKNYTQAKKWLLKAVASDPSNTDALLGLAKTYYMENELAKAGDALNLAIEKEPGYSSLWAERARIKSESDDLPGALKDIAVAVSLDDGVYGHWIDYGNYLISAAQKQEARNAFTKAIEIDPEHYLAYIYRAGLNDDLENYEEAIDDYRTICRVYPQYFYAAESLGILLWGKKDWAGSQAAFKQALYYSPKNISYALMATICLYKDDKKDEAKKFMSQYLTTLNRTSTEYFLCRLFVDLAGDADVLNRIMKEKDVNKRNRMLFYSATYYDLFQSRNIAQKYYLEVLSIRAPTFFEFRLSEWAIRDMNNAADPQVRDSQQS